ncbi:MAG: L,D-transpeptidase [Anaerolineaceae bacterium]|nr:L,D-transpeptidase [Anaerolineaceae bacterium]
MMIDDLIISRRDFLKYLGAASMSTVLPRAIPDSPNGNKPSNGKLGRVATWNTLVRAGPYDKDKTIGYLAYDTVLPLPDKIVEAKDAGGFTHYFYEFGPERYVNCGWIQEVRNEPNYSQQLIPETGCIGEICVPGTDVFLSPGGKKFKLRFYYEATFWVLGRVWDEQGTPYYQVLDDGNNVSSWYVPARAMRLVRKDEVTPISAEVDPVLKRIDIDVTKQEVRAYEGKEEVFHARVSTGLYETQTPLGVWSTRRKRPTQRMHDLGGGPGAFDLPGVPWVSFFTDAGAAFHGAYWHSNWGFRMSNGCINMRPKDALWVYRWTNPVVPFDQIETASKEATAVHAFST